MGKHDKTRKALFASPIRSNIAWKDIVALLEHQGAAVDKSAEGSRVTVTYLGVTSTFHSPHPGKETGKPTVRSVRDLLNEAEGVEETPEGEE